MRAFILLAAVIGITLSLSADGHGETPEDRLAALGHTIPPVSSPVANYVKAVRTGNLLFLAGHGECVAPLTGKLGEDLSVEDGYGAAERVALCMIATMKNELGELSKVKRFVRLVGMVNSAPDFTDQPAVINGASDLFVKVFGEKGKHARAAVGMASLPIGIAVEITLIVEVED